MQLINNSNLISLNKIYKDFYNINEEIYYKALSIIFNTDNKFIVNWLVYTFSDKIFYTKQDHYIINDNIKLIIVNDKKITLIFENYIFT